MPSFHLEAIIPYRRYIEKELSIRVSANLYPLLMAALSKSEVLCRKSIDLIPVPYYELDSLAAMLMARKKEVRHPSDSSKGSGTHSQEFAFYVISSLYHKALDYEKQKYTKRALDYYIFIILNTVPLGSAYYERPAIILEKLKYYDAALAVCDLLMKTLRWQRKQEKDAYSERFKHRSDRLKRKMKNE